MKPPFERSPGAPVGRRGFLKGAAVGAGAMLGAGQTGVAEAQAQAPAGPGGAAPRGVAPMVSQASEIARPGPVEPAPAGKPGSDFMIDVFKALDFEYCTTNPGSSVRGIHDSIVSYGGNRAPELITCCHEESAIAMGHGYAKIEGKPLLSIAHGTVGLQHAAMALYNAWCDRVPVVMAVGNAFDALDRGTAQGWSHSVQDAAAITREFTKWDDMPMSLTHFAESATRAYRLSMTPPMAPVVLVVDVPLQERPVPTPAPRVPKLTQPAPPAGDPATVEAVARMLVEAENPVIVAERAARTPAGLGLMVQLAEALQCAVVDRWCRLNFPTQHPLNQTERAFAAIAGADVVMALEVSERYALTQRRGAPPPKMISITSSDAYLKSNYQDFGRYAEADLAMAADAEATLPALIEAVRRLIPANRRDALAARGKRLGEQHAKAVADARVAASFAWDASPISTARLYAELYHQIRGEDWSLVSDPLFQSNWPLRLWTMDKHYQFIGGPGAYGVGYGAPAAVGAALANKKHGRLSVNIQGDGDLMYAPGILWTAAHHKIPLLTIVHNNRAYHNEVIWMQKTAASRSRGMEHSLIGSEITNPNIDYSTLARSMGVWGMGPIGDPKELGPAIAKALAVVKRGEPAVIDVISQPR